MKFLQKICNWYKTKIKDKKMYPIVIETPTDYYVKRGYNHPNAKNISFTIGNVVQCKITGRKAIVTLIVYLPPNRNYMYRVDGIGFDGHGWWSHHICLLGETMDKYLEHIEHLEKNSERKV